MSQLPEALYHGSDSRVEDVSLDRGVPNKDFGRGFYTTAAAWQAERFAILKARRAGLGFGWVSVFDLKDPSGLRVREFSEPNAVWFDFVLRNRGFQRLVQGAADVEADVVRGPVANDAVGLVLNQFVAGVFGPPATLEARATAIRLLMTQNLHDQVFFGTERAASRLRFREAYRVRVD